MKEAIRKVVRKLRLEKTGAVPAQAKRASTGAAPAPAKRKHHPRRPPSVSRSKARAYVTGQTVFDDRPLRFRSLTLIEADYPSLMRSQTIEGAFKIRVAKRAHAHRDAFDLVEKRYSGRGYVVPVGKRQPQILTFIAYDEGQIVGTVGVGMDSDKGLSADELYRADIDRLRADGCRVCEFTRLAVDRTAATKRVLAGLFHTAYLYASKVCGYTHAVIEVNPRHVAFYGKELGFNPIGSERLNTRVNAPAVLLCASFQAIAEGLATYAGKHPAPGTKRVLFYYGFPLEEERGVLKRLVQLVVGR